MTNFVLRNQTPDHVVIQGVHGVLKLAPLQRRRLGKDPSALLGDPGRAARRDQVLDWEQEPVRQARVVIVAWLIAAGTLSVVLGLGALLLTEELWPLLSGAGIGVLCATAAFLVVHRSRAARPDTPTSSDDASFLLEAAPPRSDEWQLVRDLSIGSVYGLTLVGLLCVALAAPAAAIYYGTELSDVLVLDAGHLSLVRGPEAQDIVVGRLLQLVLVILVSLVPALMYFQFDREKLATLIDRWLHAIFRLDPAMRTIADVDAKYGRRVEEFYGASLDVGLSIPRKRFRDRSSVIVATLLIATGWIVVLLHGENSAARPTIAEIFRPTSTPMTLAFLGAYFLAVQVTLRGYVRGDLKPKTYNVVIVRILMAVILAWTLEVLFGDGVVVLAASFLAGIIPSTVLKRIRDAAGGVRRGQDDELLERSPG